MRMRAASGLRPRLERRGPQAELWRGAGCAGRGRCGVSRESWRRRLSLALELFCVVSSKPTLTHAYAHMHACCRWRRRLSLLLLLLLLLLRLRLLPSALCRLSTTGFHKLLLVQPTVATTTTTRAFPSLASSLLLLLLQGMVVFGNRDRMHVVAGGAGLHSPIGICSWLSVHVGLTRDHKQGDSNSVSIRTQLKLQRHYMTHQSFTITESGARSA